VAEVYGKNAAGVLLTGMGEDGAVELKLMKEKGAVTIVQDEKSSVVFGMPGEAVRINAARYVLPPDRIAAVLSSLITYSISKP
jgi:two-component system chemotaxis response regulator CheB